MNIEDPRVATIKASKEFSRTPGMSFNVLNSLNKLNIQTTIYARNPETIKHRYYSSDVISGKRKYLMRVDTDVMCKPLEIDPVHLLDVDAIVVCDYLKGAISYDTLRKLDKECAKFGIPLFVDTKKTDIQELTHAIIKINKLEASKLHAWPTDTKVIVTLGERGCSYGGDIISGYEVEVVDVCGAGDAFMSGLVYGYLITNDLKKACSYGNAAAALKVSYQGSEGINRGSIERVLINGKLKDNYKYA